MNYGYIFGTINANRNVGANKGSIGDMMRTKSIAIYFLLFVLIISLFADFMEIFSQILYGPISLPRIFGDNVISISGGTLLIFNSSLETISEVKLDIPISDYTIYEDRLFVISENELIIVNISDISSPSIESRIDDLMHLNDITIQADRAYLATDSGIVVVNVEDCSSPELLDIDYGEEEIANITSSEDFIFSSTASGDIDIYNFTGEFVNSISTIEPAEMILFEDDELYVLIGENHLHIYDHISSIVDSSEIEPVSILEVEGHVNDMFKDRGTIFMSSSPNKIHSIDVNFPEYAMLLWSFETGDNVNGITYHGGNLYVSAGYDGIKQIDTSSRTGFRVTHAFNNVGSVKNVIVNGNSAYVAYGSGGLNVLDIENPSEPFIEISLSDIGTITDIEKKDSLIYLLDTAGRILTFSITHPSEPEFLHEFNFGSAISEMTIASAEFQDYIYVVNEHGSVITLNLSIHEAPSYIMELPSHLTNVIDIKVIGRYLCAITSDGLGLFDFYSTPREPEYMGFVEFEGIIKDVEAYENIVVVTTSINTTLYAIDTRYPSFSEISVLEYGSFESCYVENDNLLISKSDGQLLFYDIENPEFPILLDSEFTGVINDFYVSEENNIFATKEDNGLMIIDGSNIFKNRLKFDIGWNAISYPIDDDFIEYSSLPESPLPIYKYNPESESFMEIHTMSSDYGYYYFSEVDTTIILEGPSVLDMNIMLSPGWNLISTGPDNIPLYELTDSPIIGDNVYYYDPITRSNLPENNILHSGKAYWILAFTECNIHIEDNTVEFSKITPNTIEYAEFSVLPPHAPMNDNVSNGELNSAEILRIKSANPFHNSIEFSVFLENDTDSRIEICDINGRLIKIFADEKIPAGEHIYSWTPSGNTPSGTYILNIKSNCGEAEPHKLLYSK